MIKLGFLLTLMLMAAQPQIDVPDRYVPPTGWSNNEWAAEFYERWYGNQLNAMGERPLSLASDRGRLAQRFRLLVLPNNDPAYVYRIDVYLNGTARLRWVRLDGAGGYAPGAIAEQSSRVLRPREMHRVIAALQAASLSSRERQETHVAAAAAADGTETICHHATHFVFEHMDDEGRRFMQRPSCYVEEQLQRLVQAVYRLRPQPESR